MSLAIVGTTSLVGAFVHARRGRVDLRVAALFAATGMSGAAIGARLTHLVAPRVLLLFFAAVTAVMAALMLRRGAPPDARAERGRSAVAVLAAGAAAGVLTGFLGVGGGFIVVPALVLMARLPMDRAVGTSLLIIADSVAGVLGHLGRADLRLDLTASFTGAAVVGTVIGSRLAARTPPSGSSARLPYSSCWWRSVWRRPTSEPPDPARGR